MNIDLGSALAGGQWAVFWIQLPMLVLAVAAMIIGIATVLRAKPEDVPRVFETITALLAHRTGSLVRKPRLRRSESPDRGDTRNAEGQ